MTLGFRAKPKCLPHPIRRRAMMPSKSAWAKRIMDRKSLQASASTCAQVSNEVERFQRDRCAAGYRFLLSIRAMQPILSYLRGLGVAPAASSPPTSGALEAALERYRGYLTLERGVANESACRYINLVHPFLQTRVLPDGLTLDLRSLTAADVVSFVVTKCPRLSRGTAALTVTALRSLLGFPHVDGAIDRSLVSAVPSVPGRRLTGLPKGLAPGQVQCLLASCDTSTRIVTSRS